MIMRILKAILSFFLVGVKVDRIQQELDNIKNNHLQHIYKELFDINQKLGYLEGRLNGRKTKRR